MKKHETDGMLGLSLNSRPNSHHFDKDALLMSAGSGSALLPNVPSDDPTAAAMAYFNEVRALMGKVSGGRLGSAGAAVPPFPGADAEQAKLVAAWSKLGKLNGAIGEKDNDEENGGNKVGGSANSVGDEQATEASDSTYNSGAESELDVGGAPSPLDRSTMSSTPLNNCPEDDEDGDEEEEEEEEAEEEEEEDKDGDEEEEVVEAEAEKSLNNHSSNGRKRKLSQPNQKVNCDSDSDDELVVEEDHAPSDEDDEEETLPKKAKLNGSSWSAYLFTETIN